MIQGQHHCRGEGRNPNSRLVKPSWEDESEGLMFSLSLVPSAPKKRQERFLSDFWQNAFYNNYLQRIFSLKKK